MEQKVNNTDLELKDRLVAINRVTKVTKGGRTFSFAAIVVVGDENGIVGWGLGKANEVTTAISKGIEAAKKNLIKVPVLKGTIPHEQVARFSGSEVYMQPASSGTGLVAGGAMRAVLESAGVKDVLAKSKGSSNPHNLVKATFAALKLLRDPRMIAQQRGISPAPARITPTTITKIKITLVRSRIGSDKRQVATLNALGLGKVNSSVEHETSPQIMGMVAKVQHLVRVEEVK